MADFCYIHLFKLTVVVLCGLWYVILVLTVFSEGAYVTFKSIFHKTHNLF